MKMARIFFIAALILYGHYLNAQHSSSDELLFTAIGGFDRPILDEGMPGTENNYGGFEGGRCLKINGEYHLFPTELMGEKDTLKKEGEVSNVQIKTQIGHWVSSDAVNWKRLGTLYKSSGNYAVSDYDNPVNDRRASLWAFMPIFDDANNRWNAFYVAYTVRPGIAPTHCFGRLWHAVSEKHGLDGIGGPYKDVSVVLEPGMDTQLWEGRQGPDSFFPFKVGDKWYAFYGGAFSWTKPSDYPYNGKFGEWYIGLAASDSLRGPWMRMDTTINPVIVNTPSFVENPIVSQLPNGLYIAIFDSGPDAYGFTNMLGYILSKDGIHWTPAKYLAFDTGIKRWWTTMRTPLCLIPQGNDVYTVLFNARQENKRFQPMGLVRLKLNRKVLDKVFVDIESNGVNR